MAILAKLKPCQAELLCKILNLGVTQAAEVLNEMIQSQIKLEVIQIDIISPEIIENPQKTNNDHRLFSSVTLHFKGPFSGQTSLIFPTEAVPSLVPLLFGEEEIADLETVKIGTLSELGNIVLNGVMGAIGNQLAQHFEYAVPEYQENSLHHLMENPSHQLQLLSQVNFVIEKRRIEGRIILYFDIGSLDTLILTLSS